MKNNNILLISILCVSFIGCNGEENQTSNEESIHEEEKEEIIDSELMFLECRDLKVVDIHTELQSQCIADVYDNAQKYAKGREHLSAPKPVELAWTLIDDPEFEYIDEFSGYTVRFSDNADLSDAKEINVSKSVNSCTVTNLYINHTYYWDVTAHFGKVGIRSEIDEFKTANTLPRNVEIEGVTNCRDIGGQTTIDGKTIKQGMIYRTGRLNYDGVAITKNGIDTYVNEFNIKTEIDLRLKDSTGNIKSSPAGSMVNYFLFPMQYTYSIYDAFYCEENALAIRQVFEMFADENNYPLSYHCSIGTDRTGLITYVLLALLNVKENDIWRDYMFSNFGKLGDSTYEGRSKSDGMAFFGTKLANEEGNTLQEKARTMLKKQGLTDEKLDKIIEIMTQN